MYGPFSQESSLSLAKMSAQLKNFTKCTSCEKDNCFYCPSSLAKSCQTLLHLTTMLDLSKGPQLNFCRVNITLGMWAYSATSVVVATIECLVESRLPLFNYSFQNSRDLFGEPIIVSLTTIHDKLFTNYNQTSVTQSFNPFSLNLTILPLPQTLPQCILRITNQSRLFYVVFEVLLWFDQSSCKFHQSPRPSLRTYYIARM